VLPREVLEAPRPAPAETARSVLLLRLRQRRLAVLRRAEVSLLRDEVREVRIDVCPPCYCLVGDAPALEAAAGDAPRDGVPRLLAPLDPLIYDRRLTAALWDYAYTWEVYTPAAKRVRGYYALPVLARERLAGHVEPRADREQGRLVIVSRKVKRGIQVRPMVRELARFLGLRAIAAALLVLALQGCPSSPPPSDPDALTVATYQDFADQVRASLAPWAQDHPRARIQVLALPPNELVATLSARLATGVDAPDVLVVDASFLARLGAAGALADLSRAPHDAAVRDRAWPALVAQGRLGQAQAGVPAEAAPALLLYRADLLARAGVAEADLTGSWEGFVSACGRLRAATGAYCLPTLRDLSEAALRTGLRDGESPYFSSADEPLPDTARAARALRLATAAHTAEIEAGAPAGSEGWADLVRAGRIAVQMGGPTMIRRLARLDARSGGRWHAVPLPGGAAVSAPSAFCALVARGVREDLAFDLLRGACLSPGAAVAAYREAGAFPALLAAARDAALDEPVAFLGGQVPGPLFRSVAGKLPAVRAHRLDGLASDAFALEMDRVVQNGKDVQAAIADARAEIERRLRRKR
jgi:multiple sugar transport system substrate-binding protein